MADSGSPPPRMPAFEGEDRRKGSRRWSDRSEAAQRSLEPASVESSALGDPEGPAQRLVQLGRRYDRSGRLDEAIQSYQAAIAAAEATPTDAPVLAEALRRLAVILGRRGESESARDLCRRSYETATAAGQLALRAEALNTLGGLELVRERLPEAQRFLEQGLELSQEFPELRGRIEQNLGTLSNIRGDRPTAMSHYERSLQAFLAARNDQACAVAYHNLGMISRDQQQWTVAEQYFEQGRRTAQKIGDEHLRGLCLMNRVEVMIALQRFDAAQLAAETALSIFEELHAPAGIADVVRLTGVIFRETGRLGQAKSRLDLAVELARETDSPVSYGEALREAALLQCRLGDLDLAVDQLSRACREFSRVPISMTSDDVVRGEYPKVVRDWGELLRAIAPDAGDHADRVAGMAVATARALGLAAEEQAVIRVAGQLHEIGLLRLPRDIAAAQQPLGEAEEQVYQTHPTVGADLLAAAECFRQVAPIVGGLAKNGHRAQLHEAGDAALGITILRLVDAYDRMVSGYRQGPGVAPQEALAALSGRGTPSEAQVHQALVQAATVQS